MGMDHSRITDENWRKIKDLKPTDATIMSVTETPAGIRVELLYPDRTFQERRNALMPWGPKD